MRTNANLDQSAYDEARWSIPGMLYRLGASSQHEGGEADDPSSEPDPAERDDLPFRVELWDPGKTAVERVLAVTANGSIGYAAFYAATREYPDRYITLRHKDSIMSRWNGPQH